MKNICRALTFAPLLLTFALFNGCGVETNRERALRAKDDEEMTRLLISLDAFRAKTGELPKSLEELKGNDTSVTNIIVSNYHYSPRGLTNFDNKQWLLSIDDPLNKEQCLFGGLPVEVVVKKR